VYQFRISSEIRAASIVFLIVLISLDNIDNIDAIQVIALLHFTLINGAVAFA